MAESRYKMGRVDFRARVRAFHEQQNDEPYSRAKLARAIGLDPKTSNRYLEMYGVGWPPFNDERDGPMVYVVSLQGGTLLQVNDRFCERLGFNRNDVLGVGAHIVLRPGENLFETEPRLVELGDLVRDGVLQRASFDMWVRDVNRERVDVAADLVFDPTLQAYVITMHEHAPAHV